MPPCRLAIFDKDGTLDIASWAPFVLSLAEKLAPFVSGGAKRVCELLGFETNSGTFTRDSMLMIATWDEIKEYLVKETSEAVGTAYADAVRDIPLPVGAPAVPLDEFFGELRAAGVRVAILTSDNRQFTMNFLEHHGASNYVSTMVCGDDGLPPKPSGVPVLAICERLQTDPKETAMIGDSAGRDIGCALAAQVGSAIGVTSGVSTKEDLLSAGAHVVVATVAEVREVLLQRHGSRI